MANTEKIQALIAKIRESLQITPYATMETVNDLLEIVDLKLERHSWQAQHGGLRPKDRT